MIYMLGLRLDFSVELHFSSQYSSLASWNGAYNSGIRVLNSLVFKFEIMLILKVAEEEADYNLLDIPGNQKDSIAAV
jgi:hypothetical protein